jgi:hypothetical protein
MKTIEISQFYKSPEDYIDESLRENILVTRNGRPCAVLRGLDYDDEDLQLINSREFWKMIEERRCRPTIRWETVKSRLKKLKD